MTTAELLLLGIVTFVLIDFAASRVIDYLNESNKNQPLSPVAAEIYNADEYAKSMEYGTAKYKVELLTSVVSTVVMLSAIILGWFAWLDEIIRERFNNEIAITVTFVGVLIAVSMIGSLPVGYYSTFVIEEKYGFIKTTKKLFAADAIKGLLLSLVIGLPLLALIALVYQELQSSFWLVGWLLVSAFSLFMFVFGTRIFLPMFNKLKPLPEGELRTAVEEYCQSQGFPLSKLYEMDASKRSTKLNAFFSGMGKVKIIGLYDTLIEKLSSLEIEAVLAHELGHFKKNHIRKRMIMTFLMSLAGLALLGWLSEQMWFYESLGVRPAMDGNNAGLALALFSLVIPTFTYFITPIGSLLSRQHEFEADAFAAQTTHPKHLISALIKLYQDNAATLTPDTWYSAFYDSHPPAPIRIAHLNRLAT